VSREVEVRSSLVVVDGVLVCDLLPASGGTDDKACWRAAEQFPGFGIFRKEVNTLVLDALRGSMPGSSLESEWKYALLRAGCLALFGGVWAIRRKPLAVPLAYSGFLSGFLLFTIVTDKSIGELPTDYYLGISAPCSPWSFGLRGRDSACRGPSSCADTYCRHGDNASRCGARYIYLVPAKESSAIQIEKELFQTLAATPEDDFLA
jgi:hypothetical protein